ncbi:MAG: bifunctional glutamate N-acetyltransferase/amino-acid acetyltransferase ArgJ [Gemmatimonadetes bacterium]|nr:bifunctional glutamate N-acetyltransferase/amino-acid acetyltransferase ArgJ [Gemmatimonadota bacterium]
MNITENTIYPPKGYTAAGLHCGLKDGDEKDLALIVSDRAASAAGMFTTNRVCAAPVHLNREHLQNGRAQVVVVNSKNANACTGDQGMADARQMAQWVGSGLDIAPEDALVNSTGVIGVPLPMGCLETGIRNIIPQLDVGGWDDASEAIMTTDTVPKKASVRCEIDGCEITIAGIAKGAGMIAPNMATMLAFVLTDAALSPGVLRDALCEAVTQSFNCITVDGDMSTNDTVLALANGAARKSELAGEDLCTFQDALNAVCISLAKQIARDGEGATKLITVRVDGAGTEADARTVGLSVANSNLVKTAVFGRDPNWGRILCAAGYAGVDIDPDRTAVSMAGIPIYDNGSGLPFDQGHAIEALGASDIDIDINLNIGEASATIYTCDLTYDYVRINAEYTT